jgi:hypothetical protein
MTNVVTISATRKKLGMAKIKIVDADETETGQWTKSI